MILVFDGPHLMYRAMYTMSNSFDEDKYSWKIVTYIFFNILTSQLKKNSPDEVFVLWDTGLPKHRTQMYPAYKAHRERSEEKMFLDKKESTDFLIKSLHSIGVFSVGYSETEADDLAYFVTNSLRKDHKGKLISEDKDWIGNTTPNWELYRPILKRTHYYKDIVEKYGDENTIKKFLCCKAMIGDSSDGIIGVKGIGETYGDKYANLIIDDKEFPKGKTSKKVEDGRSIIELNMKVMDPSWIMSLEKELQEKFNSEVEFTMEYADIDSYEQICTTIESPSLINQPAINAWSKYLTKLYNSSQQNNIL